MDGPTGHAVGDSELGLAPLQHLVALLGCLHQRHVAYCYWKSRRRVLAALTGASDLDLLIARDCQHQAQALFLACGFKHFPSVASRDHPAISSFLGFDEQSGRIVHVHCHTRLMVGESLFKNYRIPWEEPFLRRAVQHEILPIRVLDPIDEALLMVVRSCVELRRTDPLALRNWTGLRDRFEFDRSWLTPLLDPVTVAARAATLLPDSLANAMSDAVFDSKALQPLRRHIRPALDPWRMYSAAEAQLRNFVRCVLWAAGGLNDRVLHLPRPWRRRASGGGCVVAIVGVDGSGKSTVVAALRSWLGGEIDVIPIYFGTGAGRPSLLLLPFKLLVPLVTRLVRKPKSASHGRISNRPPGPAYAVLMMVWATVLSVEKRHKLRTARRGAERGLIVIADRYPQDENPEYNDGPLLPRLPWAPHWLRNFESRAYALARQLPPDLVIKLDVTPKTAAEREPDMDPSVIRARIPAMRNLTFPGARVVHVDAEQPLAHVLRVAKQAIWQIL